VIQFSPRDYEFYLFKGLGKNGQIRTRIGSA
jgi:hypothetical protein